MMRVAAAGVVFARVARLVERLEMFAAVFVVVVVMVDQLVLELGGFHLSEVSVLDAEDPVCVVGGVDQVVRSWRRGPGRASPSGSPVSARD